MASPPCALDWGSGAAVTPARRETSLRVGESEGAEAAGGPRRTNPWAGGVERIIHGPRFKWACMPVAAHRFGIRLVGYAGLSCAVLRCLDHNLNI